MMLFLIFLILDNALGSISQSSDALIFHIPVRLRNQTFHFTVDINSRRSLVFAERISELYSFNEIKSGQNFDVKYHKDEDGIEATFDGFQLPDYTASVGTDIGELMGSGNQKIENNVGLIFRSSLSDVSRFHDGIFGMGIGVQEDTANRAPLSIVTELDGAKAELTFGAPSLNTNCVGFTSMDHHHQRGKHHRWGFEVQRILFGDVPLLRHSAPSSIHARLSTLSSDLIIPHQYASTIRNRIPTAADNSVECSVVDSLSDLVLETSNSTFRIPPRAYIRRVGEKCFVRIRATSHLHRHLTLGEPFFRSRCIILDYYSKRIGFANLLTAS